MKEFILFGTVTISVRTKVEAKTLEEAIDKALTRPIETYEWGNESQSKEAWVNSEYDGEVCNIKEV